MSDDGFVVRSRVLDTDGSVRVSVRLDTDQLVTVKLRPGHQTDDDLRNAVAAHRQSGYVQRGRSTPPRV